MRIGMWCLSVLVLCGCAEESAKPPADSSSAPQTAAVSESTTSGRAETEPEAPAAPPSIPSISLNSTNTPTQTATDSAQSSPQNSKQQRESLLTAMKPLQVMLGTWRGTTQKEFGDFKGVDQPTWVWDFQSDRDQPAMVMTSAESPYFRNVRLTYLTNKNLFQLTTQNAAGETRTFQGDFSVPVEEFAGDDQKMHVKYKLKLEQVDAESKRDRWEIIFNQQENHRYLVELYRGPNSLRFDTIANQREGTSFAKSDTDYGEKECIISGGLGTIRVSHNGKSYWVCCTGCKAAFEEDPATWIAEYEEKQAKKAAAN